MFHAELKYTWCCLLLIFYSLNAHCGAEGALAQAHGSDLLESGLIFHVFSFGVTVDAHGLSAWNSWSVSINKPMERKLLSKGSGLKRPAKSFSPDKLVEEDEKITKTFPNRHYLKKKNILVVSVVCVMKAYLQWRADGNQLISLTLGPKGGYLWKWHFGVLN